MAFITETGSLGADYEKAVADMALIEEQGTKSPIVPKGILVGVGAIAAAIAAVLLIQR